MNVYHVTIWEAAEQVGDMGIFGDLGGALVKVYEAMERAGVLGMGAEVSSMEEGLVNYAAGGVTWTIDRRQVR